MKEFLLFVVLPAFALTGLLGPMEHEAKMQSARLRASARQVLWLLRQASADTIQRRRSRWLSRSGIGCTK
jgi:hypothetical protein